MINIFTTCYICIIGALGYEPINKATPFQNNYYQWIDTNTEKIIKWNGDTKIIDKNIKPIYLKINLKVSSSQMLDAQKKFGIPEKLLKKIKASSKEILEKKINMLQKFASEKGISITKKNGNSMNVRPNYAWMIEESIAPVQKYARQILRAAKDRGYKTKRDLIGAVASFCQSIPYKIPDQNNVINGERINTGGVMMPIEVLGKQFGDCDSKSVLFASLIRSVNLGESIFLTHPGTTIGSQGHLFVGVQTNPSLVPLSNTEFFWEDQVYKKKYLLLELTSSWPMGHIPSSLQNKVRKATLEIIRLNNNKKDS